MAPAGRSSERQSNAVGWLFARSTTCKHATLSLVRRPRPVSTSLHSRQERHERIFLEQQLYKIIDANPLLAEINALLLSGARF
jgi:hypothetical protein